MRQNVKIAQFFESGEEADKAAEERQLIDSAQSNVQKASVHGSGADLVFLSLNSSTV